MIFIFVLELKLYVVVRVERVPRPSSLLTYHEVHMGLHQEAKLLFSIKIFYYRCLVFYLSTVP